MITELKVNCQKSFYGKALMIEVEGVVKLQSYDTIVAKYNKNSMTIEIFDYFSQTTMRHINSFVSLYTNKVLRKADVVGGLTINL